MILYQWRGAARNFGDELNSLLWPRLLPGFFDADPESRFLGIGSILDGRHRGITRKLVAGSGYGGYEAATALDDTWTVHWVGGPRTARLLGLPPSLGFGDPGSLVSSAGLAPTGLAPSRERRGVAFMPHFESAARGAWESVAAAAGLTLIDPRDDPASVLAAIAGCRTLVSEALHGVIVADALRVPWIAVEPLAPIHRPKWLDWADTLNLSVAFRRLLPSTALERAHLTGLSRYHAGRSLLENHAAWFRGLGRGHHLDRATRALRAAAATEPQLSRDTALDRGQTRMMEAVAAIRLGGHPGRAPAVSRFARGVPDPVRAGSSPGGVPEPDRFHDVPPVTTPRDRSGAETATLRALSVSAYQGAPGRLPA